MVANAYSGGGGGGTAMVCLEDPCDLQSILGIRGLHEEGGTRDATWGMSYCPYRGTL